MRLQHKFYEMHKEIIYDNVVLLVDGGVKYRAKYDRLCGRLVDLERFLNSMHVKWFNPMILTYLGDSYFLVNVFMSIRIELPHFSKCRIKLTELNKLSSSKTPDVTKDSTTWKERLIAGYRAMAIARMILYAYGRNPLIMKIESQHIAADSVCVVSCFSLESIEILIFMLDFA